MNVFKDFLESSTIHGLSYISSSRSNLIKVFWATVVIVGFITASIQIRSSFMEWDTNPTVTTIATYPLANSTFPRKIIKIRSITSKGV